MVFWRRSKTPIQAKPTRRVPAGERIYAIGDVHGCDRHLSALLDRIQTVNADRAPADVTLVMLGDYIDRGMGSARVLDILSAPPPWAARTVALKGNHEEMLERFLADPAYAEQWRQFGGLETLASFGVDISQVRLGRGYDAAQKALAERLASRMEILAGLVTHHVAGDYYFCHAGVRPGVALADQSARDLLWIRHEFLNSAEDFGRTIVHGHSPVEAPEVRSNRINVDTGAYLTGNLTCAMLDGDDVEFITVDGTIALSQEIAGWGR